MGRAILLDDLESIDVLCIGISGEAWERIEEESFEVGDTKTEE